MTLQLINFWTQSNSTSQLALEVIKISISSLLWFEFYLVDDKRRRTNIFSFLKS